MRYMTEPYKLLHDDIFALILVKDGDFVWDPATTPTLRNVNLEVKRGQKVAVCGSVSARKSSMLYAILGEVSKTLGTVDISGSIAYVSQTSWIQSGTIQDNILYGKPMNKTMYEKAIKACALDKDIEEFKHGDLTEIGQRGLNMSEGQKQRIQLARAVYNDADIYLLDDLFSVVDAHTAASLFNGKTVILVTHQVEFLSSVNTILVMKDGQVTQLGTYEELLMVGTAFEQLAGIPTKGLAGVQLTEEEKKATGNVGWKTFLDYVVISKGLWFFALTIVSHIGFVGLQAAASYWLAFASKSFFNKFKDSIFNAPMVFFDSTPVGRILTRASSDQSVIDFDIPFSIAYVIGAGIEILTMIAIMDSITWQVLIVAIIAVTASKYAQPTARELMRINGNTKAPMMNYASEISLGLATIQAFKMQDRSIYERDPDHSCFSTGFYSKQFCISRVGWPLTFI
ncbi:putative ABC-type xenobiotic transporter [Tanacetum coccineum]